MASKTYDPTSRWIAVPIANGETRVFTVDRVIEYRSEGSGAVVVVRGFDNPYPEEISTSESFFSFGDRFFAALRAEATRGRGNQLCVSPYS